MLRFAPRASWFIGLLAVAGFLGCGGKGKDAPQPGAHNHDHHHHHGAQAGPHKGMLVEIGEEEFHAEVAHDDATHEVSIYLLDKDAKKAETVELAELTLNAKVGTETTEYKLPAAPLDGEAGGKASRFSVKNEKLAEALDTKGSTFTFDVKLGGKQRFVTFKGGEAPDEHDHKDEDKAKTK